MTRSPTGQIEGEVNGLQADDSLLLESSTFNFRYEHVWGYAAPILTRYASSAIRVNAGTTIPAPAGFEDEGAGTGEGPGTPKARK